MTEYAADATTALRRTYFDYKNDSVYLDRRIIGLIFRHSVYDGSWNLVSKTEYGYDWDWSGDMFQDTPAPATQHDRTNYGPTFIVGRGNLSQTARFDVTDPNNPSKITELKWRVNSTGSVLMERDHLWHQTFFAYGDNFSDSINRNTFAYPTTLTDADGFSSTVQYNFDIGATTRTQGPPPAGQTQGAIQTMTYDSIGRLERVTTVNNGAYKRFWYGPDYIASYATVNNVADQAYSIQTFDGVGRLIGAASNHPNSTSGYKAQLTVYDLLGRAVKSSNPAEVNSGWVPAGDDAAGWLYTQQTFDWQGRPLRTTHPDLTYKEAAYSGCGCAGGEVVTLTDEGTIDGGVTKRRQQKLYSDVLGRPRKTEILNWQGGSVYSTTVNTYNARDQITLIRQYAGAEGSGTYQDTTMTYDGHGRLKTRHVPEQNAGANTVWTYNADDTINTITDARGVITTNGYNARHLVTSIIYSAPPGITPTANVTFGYDAAGNRTSMTDGQGSTSYSYDQLSRMSSETRTFSGLGSFAINYQYNLANQLSSITNPFNDTINYTRDTTGRLTAVTGTTFGTYVPVSTYASNIRYRAWDAIKSLTSGDNKTLSATFNARMLAATFSVTGLISKTYDYYADGKLRFSSDLLDHRFDRSYAFDHVARMKSAFSGAEARGQGTTTDRPYYQTQGYDSFNHLTQRTVKIWWTSDSSVSHSYSNNRHAPQGSAWQYDADGRLLSSFNDIYTYDAAGLTTHIEVPATYSIHTSVAYDGEGRQVRTDETTWDEQTETEWTETKYYVRSSVLGGQVLTELLDGADAGRTFVYAGEAIIAWQWLSYGWEVVNWEHKDPSGASVRRGGVSQELDPLGGDAGISAQTQIPDEGSLLSQGSSYSAANPNTSYTVDGMRVPVDDFIRRMGHVAADPTRMMEVLVESSRQPVGYKLAGLSYGRKYEVIYDANLNKISQGIFGKATPNELMPPVWGLMTAIFRQADFDLLLQQTNPQNTGVGTPTDLRNSIYNNKALLAKINSCLKSLLGKNFSKVGEQSLANAPYIDARLTSLGIAQKFHMGQVNPTTGKFQYMGPYATGVGHVAPPRGTIFIGSEWFNNPNEWTQSRADQPGRSPLQNAFIHELGNIISYRASGGTTYGLFGKKGATDEDSGYALQACVFNEKVNMKTP